MAKPLSDMTLEELWELFPIILTEHDEAWTKWYAEEEKRLAGILHFYIDELGMEFWSARLFKKISKK